MSNSMILNYLISFYWTKGFFCKNLPDIPFCLIFRIKTFDIGESEGVDFLLRGRSLEDFFIKF